jgi:Protein of unknown function (DUF2970)
MVDQVTPDLPKAGLASTVKAVGASFFGVRGSAAHQRDVSSLNPVMVIGVGVALAAAFVVGLVLIVKLVVA